MCETGRLKRWTEEVLTEERPARGKRRHKSTIVEDPDAAGPDLQTGV